MNTPDQVYKITIETTPEKAWEAIINPEFTRQYWFNNANISEWTQGAKWEHVGMDTGTVHCTGTVVEIVPNKRLVLTWYNPDAQSDTSRVSFEIASIDGGVELTIIHGDFVVGSKIAERVAMGWPKVIANMKEFLETGSIKQQDCK